MSTSSSEELEWLQRLQLFIYKTLQPIFPEQQEELLKYVDAPAMRIWAECFTHETYSTTVNYEDREYDGDALLKHIFIKYLRRRLPHLHKGDYTELNVVYQSKVMQGELARKMGLGDYIRVKGLDKAIFNVEADVFESFFGGLEAVADSIVDGMGSSVCYNMIVYLYKDIDINESKAGGSAKTQVIQIFVRFELPKPLEESPGTRVMVQPTQRLSSLLPTYNDNIIGFASAAKEKEAVCEAYMGTVRQLREAGLLTITEEREGSHGNTVEFSVVLRDEHVAFLQKYGVNITNKVIGRGQAATKKEAEFIAYNMALDTLSSLGITSSWAEEAKQNLDFSHLSLQPYIQQAINKLSLQGYKSMYFFIPRKTVTNNGAVVELIGVKEDGLEDVLSFTYTNDRSDSYRYAKQEVIRKFVEN